MKITWVTRSFLDYRIPVFNALDELCGHNLTVIYYKDVVPQRVQDKIQSLLKERAIAWDKELRIGNGAKKDNMSISNSSIRIPYSPGLIRIIKETAPDALISDGFMQWTYAALAVRACKKIPHVMCYERTAHMERNAGELRIMYRRFVSRWIDAICCNGMLTGEYVKFLLGWDESRLTYGHMVADVKGLQKQVSKISETERTELRNKLGVRDMMLLYVGQLISLKGVRELLSAYSHVAGKIPNMTLVLVGGGLLEDELRQRIVNERIPNVVLTGVIDYDSIASFYKAADCFILPTTQDNWSLVIPEAMACGLPVSTTIYNGCHPELVRPENGWVFDSLDPNSIEDVLLKIYNSRDLLKDMGHASEKLVSNQTAERAGQAIMDAIEIAKHHVNG